MRRISFRYVLFVNLDTFKLTNSKYLYLRNSIEE
jgi:hypothetical protein